MKILNDIAYNLNWIWVYLNLNPNLKTELKRIKMQIDAKGIEILFVWVMLKKNSWLFFPRKIDDYNQANIYIYIYKQFVCPIKISQTMMPSLHTLCHQKVIIKWVRGALS
jgi:hypothetical protein